MGPRQVGKTTLARQLEPDRTYLNFDDSTLLQAAREDPTGFVTGLPRQVTLDEIQRIPELLPAIKNSVDNDRTPGRFLLTGSANLLLLAGVQESLAGRMEVLHLHPLSEQEKQRSETTLIRRLLEGEIKPAITAQPGVISGIANVLCEGGYPEPLKRNAARARQWHRQYLKAIIQRDVRDIAAIRDEDEMLRLIELLAHRTATLLNYSNLANELAAHRDTVEKYMTILERQFLIRCLPAWHRNQAKRLIKSPKLHLVDSGLAATLMGLTETQWQTESKAFGNLLESFVVQKLICQADWYDRELRFSHYRDKDQVDVDLVIERGKEVWGIEVKKSASIQAKDGAGLSRLAAQTGAQFRGGILLYSGNNTLSLTTPNCFAVPINALWQ